MGWCQQTPRHAASRAHDDTNPPPWIVETSPIDGWAGRAIERIGFEADTWRQSRTLGFHLMEYAIIFLLFFAVLAAAWFYLMRAKARPIDSGVANDAAADDH